MQQKIDRINQLSQLARERELTDEETAERALLREAYRASIRQNLQAHLDNTYMVDEHGVKRKLKKKGE